jgi:patatin-like phospholipase/acyl hydrolase
LLNGIRLTGGSGIGKKVHSLMERPIMKWTGKKVGLALGGGGARGLAHIGVINVLNKQGIEIDLIVGTRAGALIGGAYALGMTTREITAKADAYLKSPEFEESAIKSVGMLFSPGPKSFFKKYRSSPEINITWFGLYSVLPSCPLRIFNLSSITLSLKWISATHAFPFTP